MTRPWSPLMMLKFRESGIAGSRYRHRLTWRTGTPMMAVHIGICRECRGRVVIDLELPGGVQRDARITGWCPGVAEDGRILSAMWPAERAAYQAKRKGR